MWFAPFVFIPIHRRRYAGQRVFAFMAPKQTAIVILAAGKGTRMASDKAKVLHPILGKPMIQYVVATATKVAGRHVVVVIGHQGDAVRRSVAAAATTDFAEQTEQLGTGHAVQCAMPVIDPEVETVMVLCGDVPLISTDTLSRFIQGHHDNDRDISVLCIQVPDPTGYGRILTDDRGHFSGIVEERDASDAQRRITLVNTGIYCIRHQRLASGLSQIRCQNAQGEYYLTDIVAIGRAEGWRIGIDACTDVDEVAGVNTLDDLAHIEQVLEQRLGRAAG